MRLVSSPGHHGSFSFSRLDIVSLPKPTFCTSTLLAEVLPAAAGESDAKRAYDGCIVRASCVSLVQYTCCRSQRCCCSRCKAKEQISKSRTGLAAASSRTHYKGNPEELASLLCHILLQDGDKMLNADLQQGACRNFSKHEDAVAERERKGKFFLRSILSRSNLQMQLKPSSGSAVDITCR